MSGFTLCDVCRENKTKVVIHKDGSEPDENHEKIVSLGLEVLYNENVSVRMCELCYVVLNECSDYYKSYQERVKTSLIKSPTACTICDVEGPNIESYHVGCIAPRLPALNYFCDLSFMNCDPLFVQVCDGCWSLTDKYYYFHELLLRPRTGQASSSHAYSDSSASSTPTMAPKRQRANSAGDYIGYISSSSSSD